MESALSPREIQQRIRSGASMEEVAQAAGIDVEAIAGFAAPVMAEREHITAVATSAQVRRRGESSSQRILGDVVRAHLIAAGVDEDAIEWDAYRTEGREWIVVVRWLDNDELQVAEYLFHPQGRYSVARDSAARTLIDENVTPLRPLPRDPDDEPTVDLHDEFAMVRAVQDEERAPMVVPDVPSAKIMSLPATPADEDDKEPTDYVEPEFEEVNGLYEIVTDPSPMDVLYEMLAGFNEESVRIYTGLTQPVSPDEAAQSIEGAAHTAAPDDIPATPAREPRTQRDPEPADEAPAEPDASAEDAERQGVPETDVPESKTESKTEPKAKEANDKPSRRRSSNAQPRDEEALIEAPTPRKPKSKRKRASVPSWDEILFGPGSSS